MSVYEEYSREVCISRARMSLQLFPNGLVGNFDKGQFAVKSFLYPDLTSPTNTQKLCVNPQLCTNWLVCERKIINTLTLIMNLSGEKSMKVSFNPLLTMKLKRDKSIRNAVLQVLEENPDGLPVTEIFGRLEAKNHIITPQAISQNLATMGKKGLVWKTKRFNGKIKRELWYYFSSGPFFNGILEDVKKDLVLSISKSIEKNFEKTGPLLDFRILQSALENTISFAASSVVFGEELYDEMSKGKCLGKMAFLMKEYSAAISNVRDAIIESRLTYGERRVYLHLPASLALGHPYDMSKMIIDGAINGEKKHLNAMFFLHKKAKGDLREKIDASLKWVHCNSHVILTNGSEGP